METIKKMVQAAVICNGTLRPETLPEKTNSQAVLDLQFYPYYFDTNIVCDISLHCNDGGVVMKQKTGVLFVISAMLLLLASCAAKFPFIASETLSEATELKVLCGQQKLTGTEVAIADSLYKKGSALEEKGKDATAFKLLDRAVVYYRIALTKSVIAKKEKRIAKEEQALSRTREDVSAYQQVLKELKTMEQQ